MKRFRCYFSGRVQGVGFRFYVERAALGFPGLTGFVRNLADGRVEVVAEAEGPVLDAFLEALRGGDLGRNVRRLEVLEEKATGAFADFRITF
ncbi:MAG TPA: acylphosphatase [bacterium]|uniref:acylphosphatase n=1 Tax=candidate division TA06 bacterium ADurb.Bin417 TaxID=1852828 RepID=A0A1V5MDV8_UNCT6|nr:MAG: Acylphosphatase [candidate division TA06 bacterium ADurb.Bin417]HNQ35393.1 acylphosphatase [bacterium]HNS49208.1 acylphosphatase [bacterium]